MELGAWGWAVQWHGEDKLIVGTMDSVQIVTLSAAAARVTARRDLEPLSRSRRAQGYDACHRVSHLCVLESLNCVLYGSPSRTKVIVAGLAALTPLLELDCESEDAFLVGLAAVEIDKDTALVVAALSSLDIVLFTLSRGREPRPMMPARATSSQAHSVLVANT